MKRITVDLTKDSTETLDLTDKLNPRVGDGQLSVPLHIIYGTDDSGNDDPVDMRDKDIEFLSQDTNKHDIYVSGTVTTNSKGDDPYNGNVTFVFPEGTFKVAGTYDVDKTMFRIINQADKTVLSTVNVKLNVLEGGSSDYNFDPNKTSYNSRLEDMIKLAQSQMKDKITNADQEAQAALNDAKQKAASIIEDASDQAQALLDDIKQTNSEAKGNVAGDTAATAKQAKQQANDNSGKIHDLQGEVGDARGRFMTLSDRENKQDFNIDRKEDKANANANYAAQDLRNDQQDAEIAKKANVSFITDYLSKMHLQPETFENADALKAKYPAGKAGIMVAADTGHMWIWVNDKWKDCGIYQAAGMDPEVRRRITYLDVSDEITKQALQSMTDQVVDLQWFVGSIDMDTGVITPKDRSMSAYSSLKVLGRLHTFKFDFDSKTISYITIVEFDSDGKALAHYNVAAGGMCAPSAEASAVRFEIAQPTGTMGQNDLRGVIHDSGLKITDYGARSLVNDVNHLYLTNRLLPLMATQGKTINTNVDYGEKVNTELSDASFYQVVNRTCQPGDAFIITNLEGGSSALGWAFLDKDDQLLQKSLAGAKAELTTLYAPSDANKLIVNSSLPSFVVYQYYPDASHLADINIAQGANTNRNIKLAVQPGETISLYPETVVGYKYEVLDCKAGDEFKIYGIGGGNPRLYAFLTADNHLITVAKPYLNASMGLYIKAPALAKKLVVNFNPSDGNPVELYKVPNGTFNQQNEQFKQLATPPADIRMASYLNGIKLGKDLSTHLADFAKEGDKMVHVSTFYKIGDTLYMSYYANTRTDAEDPTQHTARLVYAPFDNLSQQTYIDVADIGQKYNGQTIDAIYDSLLLKTSDDSYMIYAFTAKVGGKFYMLYRRFDPKAKLLSDIHTMNFKVGALSGTFDTVSVHDLLAQIGVDYDYEDRDISFIQKLSPRIEDGVTQYYAGIGILHMCFVVKSSDLINWTFVSSPDFKYKPEFEPSVYVKGNYVYYFCRQRGTEGNAVLAKYSIPNDQWSKPILVPDTQSRYDFFEDNDQLYLVHSPLDRNHISLMRIDQNILEKSYEVATAEVQDCFYPFTQNIDGQMYMSFTQSRHHIWLNKFSPTYYSNDEVVNAFSKIAE